MTATPHANAERLLSFRDVSMVFPDGTHALDQVNFDVHAGEFVTIVGPSGCGKSTVLRIASGLLEHSAGSYDLADDNVGYVFQDATLLPWRSVLANVELFAELHKRPANDRRAVARTAIETVGLAGFEDHLPSRLSGGMRMRVSLARSLTLDPRVFLFDEPFGALDEITGEQVMGILRDQCESGAAVLLVTHDPSLAAWAGRVVRLRDGRIDSISVRPEVAATPPADWQLA